MAYINIGAADPAFRTIVPTRQRRKRAGSRSRPAGQSPERKAWAAGCHRKATGSADAECAAGCAGGEEASFDRWPSEFCGKVDQARFACQPFDQIVFSWRHSTRRDGGRATAPGGRLPCVVRMARSSFGRVTSLSFAHSYFWLSSCLSRWSPCETEASARKSRSAIIRKLV